MELASHLSFALFTRLSFTIPIGMLLLLGGCKKELKTAAAPPPTVAVVAVSPKDVPIAFEYVAQTQSSQLVNIYARISGFLDKRMYTEGARVKAGQILFQMDEKPFLAQLDQAQAALAQNKASLEVARLNYERMKTLLKESAVAQKDFDDAKGAYESAQAAVGQAEAQLRTAQLNLSYTKVLSPVEGISSSARQADGSYIDAQNSLLTVVAVLSPIWVNFSISENEMQKYRNQVEKNMLRPPRDGSYEVEVILVDGSTFPYTGRITFAEPSYSVETGTFLIRTSVENPDGALRPNQYVHVRLNGAIRPRAILVPQRAVQEGSKGQFVWVVGKDQRIEQRPVTVGSWFEEEWFILEGLRGGEQVVVNGGLTLQPGMAVTLKPFEKKAPPSTGTSAE